MAVRAELHQGTGITPVDRFRKTPDAALGPEAMTVTQHRDNLIQRGPILIQQIFVNLLASGASEPVAGP